MAQESQESKRNGTYTGDGCRSDHQNPCFQPLQQWCPGNQGHLHANLSVRLQESQLLSDRFQLCGVGLVTLLGKMEEKV